MNNHVKHLITILAVTLSFCGTVLAEAFNLPIEFTLERASTVTVVIDDASGHRIRNLAAAVRLSAGKNVLSWDGYDDGELQKDGSTIRHLVAPGKYVARGITSDGLRLIYEFPFNSPGTPPWFTKDRSGAWLADHTSGQAVVFAPAADDGFLAKGQDRLIVAAKTAECGDAFMALDQDGRKIIGNNDFGWDGGYGLAIDRGPQAPKGVNDPWLYSLMFDKKEVSLLVFSRSGKAMRPFKQQVQKPYVWNGGISGDSLSAWNGIVVISVPQDGVLLVVDPRAQQKLVGTIPAPDPRGVLFDGQGRLLVATATQVKRLTIDLAKAVVLKEEVVVAQGLEDAQQITLDKAQNLYVGDWGKSHQVKVFNPAGKLLRTIGKPGGRQLGSFDAERLHRPKGLAIDARDQLWVVDCEHLPKRITAWSASDGKLLKSFVGGPKYGGGGTLDPEDRTRLFYSIFDGGYTFKLDWAKGTAVVDSVYMREKGMSRNPDQDTIVGTVPEDVFRVGGNTYLIGQYSSGPSHSTAAAIWQLGADGIAAPVALIGGLQLQEGTHGSWNPKRNPGVKELFSTLSFNHLVIWSDLNRDGRAQPEEFVTWRLDVPYAEGAMFNPDLSFLIRGYAMPAPKILPNGVPVWSADGKPTPVAGSDRTKCGLATGDGWVLNGAWGDPQRTVRGFRDGEHRWSYPFFDGSVIPSNPGIMVMPRRFLGAPFVARQGEAGTVIGYNGEKGSMYLMTSDGLFIQDVGGDVRTNPSIGQKYPQAKRGMVVEGVTFFDEHYCPNLSQTRDGDVILIAGKEFSAIFRVDGLAGVKRREFATLNMDAARLEGLPQTQLLPARVQGRLSLPVVVGGEAPKVDGDLKEWEDAEWAKLDSRASAAVRIVGDRLYAAWRTGDSNALANATGEPKLLFKRGGAVDLMIATNPKANSNRREPVAGDLRLIATLQDGKPTAVLYRAVVPGTPQTERVPFISPVGRVDFDRVDVVSDKLTLAQRGGDIELSIPLDVIGLKEIAAGTVIQGDIGILRGTGAITTQRLYWNNLDTAIASDVPSEVRLMPANWGSWNLLQYGPQHH